MSGIYRNRYVRAILLSGLFLQIGIWVRNFAVLLYVMERTGGDSLAISLISVAEYAPIFLFSFVAGTFADRWLPKRTMVWCDLLSAVSVVAVLLAFVFGTWKAVFFATLISAILSQFSHPSGMKLFKLHVPAEQMQAGMTAYQTLFAVFMVLGPIMGTFVFQTFGMETAMGMTALSYLLSSSSFTSSRGSRDHRSGEADCIAGGDGRRYPLCAVEPCAIAFGSLFYGSRTRIRADSAARHFSGDGTSRFAERELAVADDGPRRWHDRRRGAGYGLREKGSSAEAARHWHVRQCDRSRNCRISPPSCG